MDAPSSLVDHSISAEVSTQSSKSPQAPTTNVTTSSCNKATVQRQHYADQLNGSQLFLQQQQHYSQLIMLDLYHRNLLERLVLPAATAAAACATAAVLRDGGQPKRLSRAADQSAALECQQQPKKKRYRKRKRRCRRKRSKTTAEIGSSKSNSTPSTI